MNKHTKIALATATACSMALSAHAQLASGTVINIDYATGNGTSTADGPDGSGNGNSWTGKNGTGNTANIVDSFGNVTGVSTWMSGATGASGTGFFGWGGVDGDALQQDYFYLTDNGTDTSDLNGTTVGAFTRVTVYTGNGGSNGVEQGSQWNLTFIGGGNNNGQGLSVMVNDGGSFLTGTIPGASAGTPSIGTFDSDNSITFSNVSAIDTFGTGADIEFWVYSNGGSTSALQGLQLTLVPEPGTYALLAGLAALSFVAIRRRK